MEQVKKYGVVVGGWRLVSKHETIEQAKERASMCISRIVDIVDLEKRRWLMICEKCNKMCKAIYPALSLMVCPECRVVYCPMVFKDGT